MLINFKTIHEGTYHRQKDREKAFIFHEICISKDATRKSISEKYRIRPLSVSKDVHELLVDGLVTEGESKEPHKRGRPELYLKPNYNKLTAISMYIEGRELKGVLINFGGEIIARNSVHVPWGADNTTFKNLMFELINDLSISIPKESILIGVVLSLVDRVNPVKKIWVSSARWNNIRNLDFGLLGKERNIEIDIKRNLDAELEYQLIKNKEFEKQNILLHYWGFGIGAGYASFGRILSSTTGRFGEIGHTRVGRFNSKKCICGSVGCLETEASIWSLTPLLKPYCPEVKKEESSFADILEKPGISDLDIIDNAISFVAIELANLYKIFYPDTILFMGPFTGNRRIFSKLIGKFGDELSAYASNHLEYIVINDGFSGLIYGNVYNLFKRKLQVLLNSRR